MTTRRARTTLPAKVLAATFGVFAGIALVTTPGAYADIVTFGDGAGFTINANLAGQLAGVPNFDVPGTLQITSRVDGEATSVSFGTPQNVAEFTAEFDYHLVPPLGSPADGAAFVLQNAGPNALGAAGGSMGLEGIGRSVALVLNVYDGNPLGMQLALDGSWDIESYVSTGDVDLRAGHPIRATLDYDGAVLAVALQDVVTNDTFEALFEVDVPGTVGAGDAYVGFTGATGGLNAHQTISRFSYQADAFETLTWDERGDGQWGELDVGGDGDSRWLDDSLSPVDYLPGTQSSVVVRTNTVGVAADRSVRRLSVESGGVAITGQATLTVENSVEFAAGTSLSLSNDATLVARNGTIGFGYDPSGAAGASTNAADFTWPGNSDAEVANVFRVATFAPVDLTGTNFIVLSDAALDLRTDKTATVGPTTLVAGTLTTLGAEGGVTFQEGIVIDPAATNVGLDPQVPTDYGTITNRSARAEVIIAKGGPSTWVLDTPISGTTGNVLWQVDQGVLELANDPLDGRPIRLAGGTLDVTDGASLGTSVVILGGGTLRISGGFASLIYSEGFNEDGLGTRYEGVGIGVGGNNDLWDEWH